MQKNNSIACVAILLGVIATQAAAQEFVSQYTSADTRKCRKVERVKVGDTEYAAVWACKGLADHVVMVSEEDLRTTVSVGKSVKAAAREPAASQGFGPFNFTYETVEWRSLKGAALPFAIIQRWNVSDSENPGKDGRPGRNALLIVTRLPPGPVCHVAYVDVKANRDPNLLARSAADEIARSFDCAKDKVRIVGERGRAIELAGK
jgi:hypothetical protein